MMPSTTTQQQGGNPGLAALFRNNTAAAPGAMPQQLPQIMAPQTPDIGMPPRAQMPVQAAGGTPVDPKYAAAIAAANRHMMQTGTAGAMRNDANGLPRWFTTGGHNAR